MRAIEIANLLVDRHGRDAVLSNLSLNKLVYYSQVESLRAGLGPLFDSRIEAWQYGPVEPEVYRAFRGYGSRRVTSPVGPVPSDAAAEATVDLTFSKYGHLTAYDLVTLSHARGSAWDRVYSPAFDAEITAGDILASNDGAATSRGETLAESIEAVNEQWPNTFRLLRNS